MHLPKIIIQMINIMTQIVMTSINDHTVCIDVKIMIFVLILLTMSGASNIGKIVTEDHEFTHAIFF